MTKLVDRIKQLAQVPWLAEILTALGGISYIAQVWIYAHSQDSLLDEGLYLLKGYWFATGKYQPFQPYGFWTNHMPLSFLIPGYAQVVFGPGLRTGRYLAIFLAILFLLGLWIVSRRLGKTSPTEGDSLYGGRNSLRGDASRWLAAGAVMAAALNPAAIKISSIMTSQGLVACVLIWVMVLILGKNRPAWQIILGSFIAGALPLIRLNLLPVLPFALAYIFWENGWRIGAFATIAGLLPFLGGHALYWPNIMTMWVKWFPASLTPFLDIWRPEGIGTKTAIVTSSLGVRLASFFEGIRFHFISIMGAVAAWIFWPKEWQRQTHFKVAVFLSTLFIVLFGLHVWASVGGNYCVYCFSNYLVFFSSLGILLLIVSLPNWQWKTPPWRGYFALLVMLLTVIGIGYSFATPATHGPIGSKMMNLLERKVPAVLNSEYTGLTLWDALAKHYHWSYWAQALTGTRVVLITSGVVICAALVVTVAWFNKSKALGFSKGSVLSISFILFLALGGIISPFEPLGGGRHNYDCGKGVIDSYEEAASHISQYIKPGDLIYWQGGGVQVVLLALDDIKLFPPQLNSGASYHLGGDIESLTKYGYWNEELSHQWAKEADVLLIEEHALTDWLIEYTSTNKFETAPPTTQIGCQEGSSLHLYRRLP